MNRRSFLRLTAAAPVAAAGAMWLPVRAEAAPLAHRWTTETVRVYDPDNPTNYVDVQRLVHQRARPYSDRPGA